MKAQNTLRRKELAASISLLLAAHTGAALAQDQTDDNDESEEALMEEVVVYGKFRASLMSAMETKRDNTSIIEAISAEDLGKLPDVSIADSLARIPGVTVQRLNGRGQVVNIRGMAPDFAGGLLNGREQVSVGDNRGVEFDQYPSELLNQVVVYKTPDAQLIGQGLSGTIDLRTVRPLDYGERALTVDARYEWLEYDLVSSRDDTGYRYSGLYVDQFADDTIGLLVGYAHATLPSQGKNNNAWGYYVGDGNGNVAVGGGRVWARASELQRDSLVIGLDIKPNDRFTATFDAFYTEFEEDQIKHGMVMNLGGNLEVISTNNGIVTEGIYRNGGIATENNAFIRDADLTSLGANFEYLFDNDLTVSLDLSHSSVDRSDTAEFESNGALGGAGGLPVDIGFQTGSWGNRWSVSRDFTNLNYGSGEALYATSPFGWGDPNALAPYVPAGQFGYNKIFDIEDDLNSFRLEAEKLLELGPITGMTVGYNRSSREKTRVANEGVITSGVRGPDGQLLTETQIDPSIAGVADLSFFMFGANTSMVAYNPYDLLATGAIQQGAYLYNDILAKAWVVEEDVNSFYAMFDVDTELFGMPLTGNFGVQYQYWDQESTGQNAVGAGDALQSESYYGDDSDSEWLPSLNLNLALTDNQYLRLGMARTLVRPRMDEMKASGFYGYDAAKADNTQADIDALIATGVSEQQAYSLLSPWSRNGGNPALKPWVADSFDLSYELYFQDGLGMLSAAWFYKDLKTYIYNQNALFDFTGLPYQGATPPELFIGTTSSPANGEGGTIDGYELSLQLYGEILWDALEGFGINANYSKNNSDIEANGPGSNSPLPGLSEDVWSVQLFYERGGFSARVSQRYRDGFVGEVAGFGGARTGSDIGDDEVLDAQLSYEFQSGMFEGLSILFQGLNLTDEPYTSVDVSTGLPTEYQSFGATYAIGLTYRPPRF
jgi:iron complex outermembrane receptor protein